jgi:hypothetical protein
MMPFPLLYVIEVSDPLNELVAALLLPSSFQYASRLFERVVVEVVVLLDMIASSPSSEDVK